MSSWSPLRSAVPVGLPCVDAKARFRLFIERSQELFETRLGRGQFKANLRIEAGIDRPFKLTPDFPDEEDLRSFLLTFRQFVSDSEPIFLPRVLGAAMRHTPKAKYGLGLKSARDAYLQALRQSAIALELNQTEITPESALRLWINGWYFHNDEDKRALLKSLGPHETLLMKKHLLDAVIRISEIIDYTRQVLAHAIEADLVSDEAIDLPTVGPISGQSE